jgi:hypothetical protein
MAKTSKQKSESRKKHHRNEAQRQGGQDTDDGNSDRTAMALRYAEAGLHLVALHGVKEGLCTCGDKHCEQPGRHARTENATTHPEKIKQMWQRWPKAKIGVALSPKLVAVVVEGKAGRKELQKLEDEK